MASSNLDLVRSIYAAWGRGDFSSAQWADPEIEFVGADGPDPGRWTSVASMAEVNRDFLSVWNDWRLEAEEFRELDTRDTGVSESGIKVANSVAQVSSFRKGRMVTYRYFGEDRLACIEAVGLDR